MVCSATFGGTNFVFCCVVLVLAVAEVDVDVESGAAANLKNELRNIQKKYFFDCLFLNWVCEIAKKKKKTLFFFFGF